MFICPACKSENRASAKFCRTCGNGRAIWEETSTVKVRVVEKKEAPTAKICCDKCATTLRYSDRFCSGCGAKQPNRFPTASKFCRQCDTPLPKNSNYCFNCGGDVGSLSDKKVTLPLEQFEDEDPESFPKFEA